MTNNNAIVKHISLQPGMYVFSYVRSLTPNNNPVAVFAKRPHFGSGTMTCLYSNEKQDGQLSSPGECVVIRVGHNSIQLQVSIYDEQNANADIEFKIDTLYQQKAIASTNVKTKSTMVTKKLESIDDLTNQMIKTKQSQEKRQNTSHSPVYKAIPKGSTAKKLPPEPKMHHIPLLLSGHLEWKGDVKKKPGKWLGHAQGSKRIEAFAIDWPNRPKGVNLSYTCRVRNIGTFPSVKCGKMVGTIHRALPITEIQFVIGGKKSDDYIVKVQAAFSETGVQQKQNKSVLIKAIHESEFLTGLKIDIVKIQAPLGLPSGKKSDSKKPKFKKDKLKNKKGKKNKKLSGFDDVMVFRS